MSDLQQAKRELWEKAKNGGGNCPCCDRFTKVYRRKFNSRMARALIVAYHWNRRHPREYVELANRCIEQYDFVPGDHAKLRWWGLLEKDETATSEHGAKSAGMYRITEDGVEFVLGRQRVWSHVVEYNSKPRGFDGVRIDIEGVLGRHFNYRELMRA